MDHGRRASCRIALPLVIAVLGACGDSQPTVTTPLPPQVASLSFVGAPPTGAVGLAVNLTVLAKDVGGNVMPGQNITWTVSNWRVATTGPSTGATWIRCATEGAACTYTGAKLVRYGLGNTFFFTQGTGGTVCSSAAFGGDPLTNIVKECWYADMFQSTGSLALRPMARGAVTVTASLTDNTAISTTTALTIGLGTVTKWGAYCGGRCNGTLAVGTPETMWPVPWDSLFNVLAVPIKATSSNPAVATVSLFTAKQYTITPLSAGTAIITFAPDSAFAGVTYPTTYAVTVPSAAPVAEVAGSGSIAAGGTTQLTAKLRDPR